MREASGNNLWGWGELGGEVEAGTRRYVLGAFPKRAGFFFGSRARRGEVQQQCGAINSSEQRAKLRVAGMVE